MEYGRGISNYLQRFVTLLRLTLTLPSGNSRLCSFVIFQLNVALLRRMNSYVKLARTIRNGKLFYSKHTLPKDFIEIGNRRKVSREETKIDKMIRGIIDLIMGLSY